MDPYPNNLKRAYGFKFELIPTIPQHWFSEFFLAKQR